jgi:hypothetical protein
MENAAPGVGSDQGKTSIIAEDYFSRGLMLPILIQ